MSVGSPVVERELGMQHWESTGAGLVEGRLPVPAREQPSALGYLAPDCGLRRKAARVSATGNTSCVVRQAAKMLSSQMYKEAGFSGLMRASAMGPVTPASPLCASRSFDVAEWVSLSNVLSLARALKCTRAAPVCCSAYCTAIALRCGLLRHFLVARAQLLAQSACHQECQSAVCQAGHTELASCCACCL